MKHLYTTFLLSLITLSGYGQAWSRTNASIAATGTDARMFAANAGDTIMGIAPTQQGYKLTVSTDKGATWSNGQAIFDTLIDGYTPEISALWGIHDRFYVNINLFNSTYYNIYFYSEDLGNTWIADTAGLSRSFNPAYVNPVEISALSGGYMVAYNSTQGAYFKHISNSRWVHKPTSSSFTGIYNLDFTYIGNTWYALNNANQSTGEVINTSTDFGQTWTTLSISGLPTGFAPYNLVSNHNDKLFLSGSIAGSDANQLYYSIDNGSTWDSTNTAAFGQYNFASVYLRDLFAIEDYVFATFFPTQGDTVSRVLSSSTAVPNFSLADVSGLPVYPANQFMLGPPTLNYFNIDNILFITYADDIYSSTPGFTGTNPGIGLAESLADELEFYPNPASDKFVLDAQEEGELVIFDLKGTIVYRQQVTTGENVISFDIPNGIYILSFDNRFDRLVVSK
ncbi:T9SS type A sorting domain-containing protein [Phaeocystidibacter luteus]|uniref:T9SS type A sorting domain-containing protein n=1 Tax=Phaeocystidibacter luteus TaxID=911197 RepID=A0A6N6RCT4_9FLAO|nr:T9SS type A sorting domain-containing protein [Phaeocystidibacter luteus]KAB2804299.1 T9SS type A sorting domain-containing protein [Phaeocystidibacter luteus]